MSTPSVLPIVTSSERVDFKRCEKRWYWKWRRGLVPRNKTFGALDLGTWMHEALAAWYQPGSKRDGYLSVHFETIALEAVGKEDALNDPDELIALGSEMAKAYQYRYGKDSGIRVLATELPLEFTFPGAPGQNVDILAVHKLKPDLIYADQNNDVWLMEHKTAKSIQTGHLPIDDQARPYGAMAGHLLAKKGVLKPGQQFRGIMYNFMRKALVDERPQNSKGHYLNKDGSVSKRQPPAYFVRKPIAMSRKAKIITLERVRNETLKITLKTLELRTRELHPNLLGKTPHKSCEKTCPFFAMCVAEDEGANIRDMQRSLFKRENPYAYHAESTEDVASFELG